ncbi:MAG: cytochrome c [Planctomycetaceae bacterium]|nr:cytochrome c [Planctomycetaceae bacterium]
MRISVTRTRREHGHLSLAVRTALASFRLLLTVAGIVAAVAVRAEDGSEAIETPAARGFRFLTETALIPPDFQDETFQQVWQEWPERLRARASQASDAQRRQMAFERYGLTPRPGETTDEPLQYVVNESGGWCMNCFTCHGGTVYGQPVPGAPNNRIALHSLVEETWRSKIRHGLPPSRMDLGAMAIPLGTSNGTTNAVVFGMGLMHNRDAELNLVPAAPKLFTNHDMDAPPWWYFYKRPYMYIDGFAQKGHRGLMQFTLVPENGPDFYAKYEDSFRDVLAYITSLRPPKFPALVNQSLADRGRALFLDNCARCHGTYGENWTYPNRRIPLNDIGTDPVRLTALSVAGRQRYANSWFAKDAAGTRQQNITDPNGYVAPPLDGVWASAPYFHNGSVPTLWGVLNPDQRPAVWRAVSQKMNKENIGLTVEVLKGVPNTETDRVKRRGYFDTRLFGKSNKGHTYPDSLSTVEKRAVLEYLKTL